MNERSVVKGLEPLQPIPTETYGEIIYEKLKTFPSEKVALVDAVTDETLSCGELLKNTLELADGLHNYGCRENTKISICSENSIHFFAPVIASLYIGSIVVPLNPNYTEGELLHMLNLTEPEVVFCSPSAVEKFKMIRRETPYIRVIITINFESDMKDAVLLSHFVNQYKKYGCNFVPIHYDNNNTAVIFSSSGTTGFPKGVMLSSKTLIVKYLTGSDHRYFNPQPNSKVLGNLPFFHGFGYAVFLSTVVNGHTLVVMPRFSDKIFLKAIQDHKIRFLMAVPPLAVFLAKSPLVDQYDISCVTDISCGAAPLSKETENLIKKRLKHLKNLRQAYGLTEATTALTVFPANSKDRPGSSGIPLPYMSLTIRDAKTGNYLGPGEIGEICIKGPLVMNGYYKNQEATKNSFDKHGWLLSGDLGYYDEDGYLYVVERIKELIKYKAYQVAPAELEALLLKHPKINDAAIIGVPNDDGDELPLAFVVLQPGSSLTEKEVQDYMARQVASYKRLRGGVIFVPSIPKIPSGKILRRKLRELLTKHKSKL